MMPSFRQMGKKPPAEPLDERQEIAAWRWTSLIDAWMAVHPGRVLSDDQIGKLGKVARGEGDIEQARTAVREGCDPDTLARIYV